MQHARALGTIIPNDLLAIFAPLGWEHFALTGDFVWSNSNARQTSGLYAMFSRRSWPVQLSLQFCTNHVVPPPTPQCAAAEALTSHLTCKTLLPARNVLVLAPGLGSKLAPVDEVTTSLDDADLVDVGSGYQTLERQLPAILTTDLRPNKPRYT